MQSLKEMWSLTLKDLEAQVPAFNFDLWIKNLEVKEIREGILYIIAPTTVCKNRCNQTLYTTLKTAIFDAFKESINAFEILTMEEFDDLMSKKESIIVPVQSRPAFNFNSKYTFDNFVVGNSNKIVYAACRSVAENPSGRYNPLFIYGGVGLGKTHLLHAIGNYISSTNPELNVLYVTCEKFTNDYIDCLLKVNETKRISEFRAKYRNVDVLMVDDIQFISKKEATQEEFFHTFNDLYNNNKQIVIASDRRPENISTLSDRLRSRFQNGLIQDIQNPDFETKVAILMKKAEQEQYNVENDVITYLAENTDTNIREMEGLLKKVVFYANLMGKHFADKEDAMAAIKEEIKIEKSTITPDTIIAKVCEYYHVSKEDVLGKKKTKEVVDPRQIAIYLICDMLDMPLKSIGNIFNGRDHTTMIHSRDKITEQLKTNKQLVNTINDLKNMIR